ncbi:peptidase inhibitor family I36 protein [Sphaerisporangium sp. B11E5]|uniref:peptidase inhibitor family I36 protein n=1 Tax=Sphaerisporangium sp. B11E5 TaxID=3153563 RepID=UPI00325DB2F4
MKRRLSLLATGGLGLSLLTAVAPAGAAHADARCPTGSVCVWSEAGYEGTKYTYEPSTDLRSDEVLPFDATSAKNSSPFVIDFGNRTLGVVTTLPPGGVEQGQCGSCWRVLHRAIVSGNHNEALLLH